jgi:hypothetical protein
MPAGSARPPSTGRVSSPSIFLTARAIRFGACTRGSQGRCVHWVGLLAAICLVGVQPSLTSTGHAQRGLEAFVQNLPSTMMPAHAFRWPLSRATILRREDLQSGPALPSSGRAARPRIFGTRPALQAGTALAVGLATIYASLPGANGMSRRFDSFSSRQKDSVARSLFGGVKYGGKPARSSLPPLPDPNPLFSDRACELTT